MISTWRCNFLKSWFEMNELRKKRYNNAVWIPLYGFQELEKSGIFGHSGYKSEIFACGTLAVPIDKQDYAESLGWHEIGIGYDSTPWIDDDGNYIPSDTYKDFRSDASGIRLVLTQSFEAPDEDDLFLHQDFVLALGLKREEDKWLRPVEDYIEVARIKRNENGTPNFVEVRAEHLKDYLCARKMILKLAIYREREIISEDKPDFSLETTSQYKDEQWEGHIQEIHDGGEPFGAKMAILHVVRTDIDGSDDVPVMGELTDDSIESTFYEKNFSGKKCYRIRSELWKNEWIEPAKFSPRVSHDEEPSIVYFITDAEGTRENKDLLIEEGRWLWFNPAIIPAIASRRGGNLQWYTAHTGSISYLQSWNIHFGINDLGYINVYAKDIALLPNWLQQIWAGHNVSPDGKISAELLDSQIRAEPADTKAPEMFLERGILQLNKLSVEKNEFPIIRETDALFDILKKCHRFRSLDLSGLYALAKDLARVTADSIDSSNLQKIIAPPKDQKWGSLKSLENYLGTAP